jgi:hypothetical protein
MGKKVLEGDTAYQVEQEDFKNGRAPTYDVTELAHYNAKDNHCYVELTRHAGIGGDKQEPLLRELYDGQTGEVLAALTTGIPPEGGRFGVTRPARVPASALPTPPDFSRDPAANWNNNQADTAKAYIDYLMEGEGN